MPTITIRLSDSEKADLESAARRSGSTLSDYVRETLALREEGGIAAKVADIERRLADIERLAGDRS